MRPAKPILIFLFIVASLGCNQQPATYPRQSVYLFKDKDGLYRYDFKNQKETLVLKAGKGQIFLEEPCKFLRDTLIIGIKGGFSRNKNIVNDEKEIYYNDYCDVDLRTGEHWISKKIFYETRMQGETLKMTTQFFARNGKLSTVKDSLMKFESGESSYKGAVFNTAGPRFFSKSTVGDKTVYSLRGNIYLAEKGDTTLLVKFEGHFDPKFGSGYLSPKVDPTGSYALFVYAPGAFHFFERESLQRIDLKTKKVTTVLYGAFTGMTFSNDGNFLLFRRNEREGPNDTWQSDIFILDLHNLKEHKIGNAYSAQWSK
jgi:hypothetical protein